MIGVDSTLSPTPQGRAKMAMSRKAEEMIRSVSRWSFRAKAAAATGIRLMVTGKTKEGGRFSMSMA